MTAPSESELRRLYHNKGLTQEEIGDIHGVTKTCVSTWMSDAGIEARSRKETARRQWGVPSLRHDNHGYEWFQHDGTVLLHHRLLAVAEFGFDAVVDNHVHHPNELKWDNRPDNIELKSAGDHASHHHKTTTFTDDLLMNELYHNDGKTQTEIGEIFEIDQAEVSRRVGCSE